MKTKLLLLLLLANFSIYSQINLVPNGDFAATNGVIQTWTIANVVNSNYDYASSQFSAKLSYTTVSPKITTLVPMKAGVTYTVKYKYKYISSNYSGDHPISLNISQNGSASTLSSSTFATNNLWTEKSTTFTADSDLSYNLSISTFSFDSAAYDVLIDDVQVYVQGTEQLTSIPDVEFEKKLIALGIDFGATDGKVPTININSIKTLDISNSLITDLTGIADFKSLTALNCSSNKLTSLDISNNTTLTLLDCSYNFIKALDLAKNTNLTFLDCTSNQLPSLNVSANTALQYMQIGNNGNASNTISSLDLSQNINLLELTVRNLRLTSLDLSKNTALKKLDCAYLNSGTLSSLDVSANTQLESLIVHTNNLTSLDVSKNKSLKRLICYYNQITSLDLSGNNALILLSCSDNKLNNVNLKNGNNSNLLTTGSVPFRYFSGDRTIYYDSTFKNNPNLFCVQVDDVAYSQTNWTKLKDDVTFFSLIDCGLYTKITDSKFEDKLIALQIDKDGKNGAVLTSAINTVTSLDVSNSSITDLTGIQDFAALTNLNASTNLLKRLDVSKNTALNTLNTSTNPSLTCIQVANVAATANWTVTKDATASFNLDCTPYTLIPDANFEDKLIALQIDKDGKNGKVKTESISTVTALDISSSSISDLTGIQDFSSLTELRAYNNNLTAVDVTKNTKLTTLRVGTNQLTTLNVSQNTALTYLDFSQNKITTIDLAKNTELTYFGASSNLLSTIDLSQNTKIGALFLHSNMLVSLDVSKNLSLNQLWCFENQIRTLDFSQNTKLVEVLANTNRLINLNIKNGKNIQLGGSNGGVRFTQNPELKCIQVDDVNYSNANWGSKKDVTAIYSVATCPVVEAFTLIPDPNFEDKLIALQIDKDGKNGKVATTNVAYLTTLNVSNSNISDLTGIEDFASLTSLECNNNQLKTINVSKNRALTKLNVSKNQLTVLSVSENTLLNNLNCSSNAILVLDVSKNIALNNLSASFNKIQYLDVSANKTLKELDCAANDLYNLNLKNGNNANMQNVIFGNFTQNPNLLCIQVDDAAFSTANWIAKDATANYSTTACEKNYQYTLIPDSNFENVLIAKGIDIDGKNGKVRTESIAKLKQLTTYDSSNIITDLTGIQDFTELEELSCNSGKLAKLDVSKNLKLKILSCSNNQLTSLDLSKNLNLTSLNANTNSLTALDVSANTALVTLLVSGNKLTTINIDSNDKLRSINLSNNLLTAVNLSKNALLTQITISNNKIANLDLSENFSLQNLNASYNLLTGINLSSNTALLSVELSSNQLKNISLSQNLALTSLTASYNVLPGIDVSKNTALTYLDLSANQITTIDLSSNTALGQLYIGSNRLSVLELAKNTELTYVYCYNNIIRTLDFSKNTKLTNAFVYSNKLVNLNLKNGKNTLIKDLSAATNSDLTCIQVDDVAYSNTNWANKKDATASYSSDACPVVVPYTLIPDSKFEDKLIALQIDKDGKNGKVATMSIATLTSLDVSKSEIADLTGLQDFNLLTTLNVSNNVLTTINISKNTYLTSLNVSNNKLTTLVVPATIPVSNLNCSNNEIATLDVSKNTSLTYLSASFNKLKTLDVSKNTILKEFDCAGNDLYNLNLKNGNNANMQRMIFGNFTQNPNLLCIQVDDAAFSNDNWIAKDATATYSTEVCQTNYQYTLIPDLNFEKVLIKNGIDKDGENGKVRTESIAKLTQLSAYDSTNKITDLTGIQDFAELETLDCSNGAIKVLDISKNLKLKSVNCSYNALTTLDVSKNAALTVLNASANQLTSVNVSSNLALTNLSLSNNQLTTVNVANNTALKSLALANNQLTSIDVNKNSALTSLDLFTNKLTSVDILNNTALTTLNVAYNQLTSFDVSKNTLLTSFSGASNQLTSIDLSKLTVLKGLDLANNKLTSLDIATNTALLSLYVQGNNLTSLNLKNGKNTLLTNYNISFRSNPKLTCILVDDVTFANNNWSGNKDVTATYNTECTGELVLPANNFAIETKGESCLGENNGEISIVAKTAFDYTATINDKPYAFVSNSLKVAALAPGVYKIKITIPGMIFEQNFNVTIAKGATITGKSSIASKKVDVEITEGTAPFTVFVDGNEQFQTTASNFSIELNEGGLIEVVTSKACEGVYAKKIKTTDILGTVLSAYPNPTNGSFEIEIPTDKNEVTIELYNFGGQLVSRKAYVIENGTAKLNLENQPSGIYAAKIYLETPEYIKIIKK